MAPLEENTVERWGLYEIALKSPAGAARANPFTAVRLCARFRNGKRQLDVGGFYDGDNIWRVRFMPDALGRWTWKTESNAPALDGRNGSLICVAPSVDNHGPVHATATGHFSLADGTPFFPMGTTAYAWKDRHMLFVGPPRGGTGTYDVEIHDAWNCRLVRRCAYRCGMACQVSFPAWAAIVLRRHGERRALAGPALRR